MKQIAKTFLWSLFAFALLSEGCAWAQPTPAQFGCSALTVRTPEGWLPEGMQNQFMALATLFFALDGINEKGLAVADLMAGDNAETHQDSGKPALTTTSAICYLLKNAATSTNHSILNSRGMADNLSGGIA